MNRWTHAILVVLSIALASCAGQSGEHRHPAGGAVPPPMVYEGLGSYHQSITASDAAQAYFDQGLRLVYAFNHLEAESAFLEATRLDPTCAMCYWGIALSQGSNYNSPTDADRERTAFAAIQQAVVLAGPATDRERATIEALSKRHADTPTTQRAELDRAYADAMREVARRFPDDLDAATLFADALMNLRPWNLWKPDGSMQPETRGDPRDPGTGAAREPGPPGRAPSLHPRRRGRSRSEARRGGRRPAGTSHAGGRASSSTCPPTSTCGSAAMPTP